MPRITRFVVLPAVLLGGGLLCRLGLAAEAPAAAAVYTYHGDNMRTGWYRHETAL